MSNDTIAALATAPHPAGIAIIRVSGDNSKQIINKVFKAKAAPDNSPREFIYGKFIDPDTGQELDKILAVFMSAPNSYTGEDVVELHLHGNPLLAKKMLRILYSQGARPAEAGEFTKRAFLNGKLDLTQAEGVSEVISASSESALKVAREHLSGRLSSAIEQIAEPLRDVIAEIEASIDFPEEDISPDTTKALNTKLKLVKDEITKLESSFKYGRLLREGFRVLLCGCPNVGKSSLLNRFLGTNRAIVTEISGTTRDVIEEACLINDHRFVFCDSAGITTTRDKVEQIGIELTRERIPWADLVLLVADATEPEKKWHAVLDEVKEGATKVWLVINKIDLVQNEPTNWSAAGCEKVFQVASTSGLGFEELSTALVNEIEGQTSSSADSSQIITSERHLNCLKEAFGHLNDAQAAIENSQHLELIAADLRSALAALEEIVGKTYNEDILGRIFAKFCIGK